MSHSNIALFDERDSIWGAFEVVAVQLSISNRTIATTTTSVERNVTLSASAKIFFSQQKIGCTDNNLPVQNLVVQNLQVARQHMRTALLPNAYVHPISNPLFEPFGPDRWLIVSTSGRTKPVVPTFGYLVWRAACSAGARLLSIFLTTTSK